MSSVTMQVRPVLRGSKLFASWVQRAKDKGVLAGCLGDGVVHLGSAQDYALMGPIPRRCQVQVTLRFKRNSRRGEIIDRVHVRATTILVDGHEVTVEVHPPGDYNLQSFYLTGADVGAVFAAFRSIMDQTVACELDRWLDSVTVDEATSSDGPGSESLDLSVNE